MAQRVTVSQLVYMTPRVFLREYLNNETDETIAVWVVRNKSFRFNSVRITNAWASQVRPTFRGFSPDDNIHYFMKHIYASTLPRETAQTPATFVTKTEDKRKMILDLEKKPLYEWMILFLLEQSRTDWIDWKNEEKKEFHILDMKTMGEYHARVHGVLSSSPLYYIKMLLSSYCMTGILKPIDKKNNHYSFNEEWYQKELLREEQVTIEAHNTFGEELMTSCVKYPNDTIFPRGRDEPMPEGAARNA